MFHLEAALAFADLVEFVQNLITVTLKQLQRGSVSAEKDGIHDTRGEYGIGHSFEETLELKRQKS